MSKKYIFLHGLESTPNGTKSTYLKNILGDNIYIPNLQGIDRFSFNTNKSFIYDENSFYDKLIIAEKYSFKYKPKVIIGSSMGGAMALSLNKNILQKAKTMILIAPAWKHFPSNIRENLEALISLKELFILHSTLDKTVSFEDTIELTKQWLPNAIIIPTGNDHRCSDEESLQILQSLL